MLLLKKAAFNYAWSQSQFLTKRVVKAHYTYLLGTHKHFVNMRKNELVQSVINTPYYHEIEKMIKISVIEYIAECVKDKDYDYAKFPSIYTKHNLIRRYTERCVPNGDDKIGIKALAYLTKHNLTTF